MKRCISYLLLLACCAAAQSLDPLEEAKRLYKVGEAALAGNDLDIAARNFRKAAELAPHNAVVRLNLAIVQNRLGHVGEARVNAETALKSGNLDVSLKEQAEKLLADLEYKSQKKQGLASKLASLFSDSSVSTRREWNGGSCRDESHYWGGQLFGCTLSVNELITLKDGCTSPPVVRTYHFPLDQVLGYEVHEIRGTFKGGDEFVATGGIGLSIRLKADARVESKDRSTGETDSYSTRSKQMRFADATAAEHARDLMESYAKVCRGTEAEEKREQEAQESKVAARVAQHERILKEYLGTWSSVRDRKEVPVGACYLSERLSRTVALSASRMKNGVLYGTAQESLFGDSHTRSRGFLSTETCDMIWPPSGKHIYLKKIQSEVRVWVDSEDTVRMTTTNTCSGDCNDLPNRTWEKNYTLSVSGGTLVTKDSDNQSLYYTRVE